MGIMKHALLMAGLVNNESNRSDAVNKGPRRIEGRSADRLAQRDPEWAKNEAPDSFALGYMLGALFLQVCRFLEERSLKTGLPIFCHGRDGELIYSLLRWRGLVPVSYGITSRSCTTQTEFPPWLYFEKVVPKEAIHFDTGFSGSIPDWFSSTSEFNVTEIWLLCHINRNGVEDRQIPLGIPVQGILEDLLYYLVGEELEEGGQRLSTVKASQALTYSNRPEQFWARLYGAKKAILEIEAEDSLEEGLPPSFWENYAEERGIDYQYEEEGDFYWEDSYGHLDIGRDVLLPITEERDQKDWSPRDILVPIKIEDEEKPTLLAKSLNGGPNEYR